MKCSPVLMFTIKANWSEKWGVPFQRISIRLDRDIVERFKATGKGWQTHLNDSLRKVMPV